MTWNPVTKHISTPFAENVSPDNALPEHPRPQMVRQHWQNLNGLWDYALEPIGTTSAPAIYQGQILVPFAIDAPLSGITEILRPNQRLWYRRNFCDRLGLLVWQDLICMPKFGQTVTPEAAQQSPHLPIARSSSTDNSSAACASGSTLHPSRKPAPCSIPMNAIS